MSKLDQSFVERLREHALRRPNKVALRLLDKGQTGAQTLTYAELDKRVRAVAAYLQAKGAQGERVLLLLPTGLGYVSSFLGALYAGAVAVPAYPPESQRRQHLQRLVGIAGDARPSLVLTDSRELARLRSLLPLVPELDGVECVAVDAIDSQYALDFAPPSLGPETLAFLQYTSGSIGAPKGVMLSHGNLLANELAIAHALAFDEHDVMVSWLPLFHDMGMIGGLLQPLFAGATLVLMSPLRFLERPLRWLEAISQYRGTVSGGPDFAYRMCVDRIEPAALAGLDLSSWRLAFCGSEPIRANTLEAFAEKLAPTGFSRRALFPCYGLAEATLLVSGVMPGQGMQVMQVAALPEAALGSVSCGSVPPEHTVTVVDPATLEPRAEAEIGEICVSGPSIAQGYWNNPEASASTFVPLAGRRALRTGDLGFQRAGELYITGRLKDLIILRGRNIVPQDIEDALARDVPPLQLGRIAAFAWQFEHGEAIGIAAEVSRSMARAMRPEALCQVISATVHAAVEEPARLVLLLAQGQLPRTSSGKLQRRACAERHRAGELHTLAVVRDGKLVSHASWQLTAAASSEGT